MKFYITVFFLISSDLTSGQADSLSFRTHNVKIKSEKVYKYNATGKDSSVIYYAEYDSTGKKTKTEGRVFFQLPFESSLGFKNGFIYAKDGDTIFNTLSDPVFPDPFCNVGYDPLIGSLALIIKCGANKYPSEINKYVYSRTKNPIGTYLGKAYFTYSDDLTKVNMQFFTKENRKIEKVEWVYNENKNLIRVDWDEYQDGFFYKIFYSYW